MVTNSVNNYLTDDSVNLIGDVFISLLDEKDRQTGWLPRIKALEFNVNFPLDVVKRTGTGRDSQGNTIDLVNKSKKLEITIKSVSLGRKPLSIQFLGTDNDFNQDYSSVINEEIFLILDRWVSVSKEIIVLTSLTVRNEINTFIENRDYVVDYENGMIMALSNRANSESIFINNTLCNINYNSPKLEGYKIDFLTKNQVPIALKFSGKNRVNRNYARFFAKKMIVLPENSYPFMGKESAFSILKGEVLLDRNNQPSVFYQEFKQTI